MLANNYHLITHWFVPGTPEDLYQVLSDIGQYPRWWPDAFLNVQEEWEDGQQFASCHVRGYLPYTLQFRARIIEETFPYHFTVEASGDFNGRGIWSFEPHGSGVHTTYDWQVRVSKPLIRYLSFMFEPLFASNHYWAMGRGEERIRQEMQRLSAHSPAAFDSRATIRIGTPAMALPLAV
jgi:hypothetical protein